MDRAVSPRLGVVAGYALAVLCLLYAIVLAGGLYTLASPDQPIQQPWFACMELLILAIAPLAVAFMVALHAWAPEQRRPISHLGIVFMSMCSVVTCGVHFVILTLGREPAFSALPWAPLVFSFRWPSLVYALDILAWDFLFPLAAMCAALTVSGREPTRVARSLFLASAAISLLGLIGVPLGNMSVRNIGILGYVVLFPVAGVLMAARFRRESAG
ncbi:MAG TPA: hypothetical protein VMC02_09110 [Steroidobacteraceae bacterium]|nr:hypothetical protein [Steroidobacteraceae bacterium]